MLLHLCQVNEAARLDLKIQIGAEYCRSAKQKSSSMASLRLYILLHHPLGHISVVQSHEDEFCYSPQTHNKCSYPESFSLKILYLCVFCVFWCGMWGLGCGLMG